MIEPKQPPRRTSADRMSSEVIPFKGTAIEAGAAFPTFTWDALELQLADLSTSPQQRSLVQTLISATRKQAAFKPADLVLREVLCIASVLMDETFHPEASHPQTDASDWEEGGMT